MTAETTGQPGEDTISRSELGWALREVRELKIAPEDENNYPALADMLFELVRRLREPEYEPGAVYEDASGKHWEYRPHPDGICPWLKPGSEGRWSTGTPQRPLRRLVPEGSQ